MSRSLSPFSVFLTFMLVLVELPSNTMRGLFFDTSTVLLLKSKRHFVKDAMWNGKAVTECQVKTINDQKFTDETNLLYVGPLEKKFSFTL